MERTFDYRNVRFAYRLAIQKRKNIGVAVYPDGSVVVKAPRWTPGTHIEDFLRDKAAWVLKQKQTFAQHPPPKPKQYVSGEAFYYRGLRCILQVEGAAGAEGVALEGGRLQVFSEAPANPDRVAGLLSGWYRTEAERVFRERLEHCFGLFDYPVMPALSIRDARSRWGSYSRRTHRVMLNLKLIHRATRLLDYVAVHELCHIRCPGHDRSFYALQESVLPNWRALKKELNTELPE